jgi:hypothetical protein
VNATARSVVEALLGQPAEGSPVVQIAFMVPDIPTAARAWADTFGAGPFFRLGDEPIVLDYAYHAGAPAAWSHCTSVGQCGRVQIELMEQYSAAPPALADTLAIGAHGLHHFARLVDDLDAESARLEALGCPEELVGSIQGQEFRFHDGRATVGCRLEFYLGTPGVLAFFGAVARAAQGWDGRDPIRSIADLDLG